MWKNKPTVVIGATPNTDRYSFKATVSLQNKLQERKRWEEKH